MKKISGLMFYVALLFVPTLSWGAATAGGDFAIEAGFRQQSADTDTAGIGTKSQVGYNLGVTAAFPATGPLWFRTGLHYTQRPIVLTSTASPSDEAKISMTYFDIPLELMYKFEDFAGVYGGLILSMNLDKTYSGTGIFAGGSVTGVKSTLTPFVIGAAFKFAPQLGANVFFETGGDAATGLKNYRSVGVNFMFTFD